MLTPALALRCRGIYKCGNGLASLCPYVCASMCYPVSTTPLISVYSEYVDFYLFRSSTPLGSQGTASPISQHTCHFPLGQGKHSLPISYAELSFFPIYFEYFQLGSGLKKMHIIRPPNLLTVALVLTVWFSSPEKPHVGLEPSQ